ncbi:MAG: hypothetical protein K2L10_05170 [Ruminococcus sp.]|nr:hypothetical protein [Ruminococcus sp.]
MRKTRFFIIAFVLVGIMFVFSGCAYYSSDFDFEFKGEYMADKYVDLLIPIDENDEFYTSYNCNIEGDIEIPENSEIVNYNKDGFRSMLIHMKESKLGISIRDSEYYPDSHEKYNGTPSEIRQWVRVPYYEGRYTDHYNEEMFLEFCNKYKKCYVAVFDGDGNIVQISKKIPLVSLGNFYLQDISYDVEKNRINPYYKQSVELSVFTSMVWLFSVVGVIGCIITLIVYKINHNQWDKTYKKYIIATSLFNVPSVLCIVVYIYTAFGKSLTIADFFINLFTILITVNIYTISVPITILTLCFFIFREKQLRLKKILEEKHRAESIDISEKI